jgi:hypothetical protein
MDTSPSVVGTVHVFSMLLVVNDVVGATLSVNFSQLASCSCSGSTWHPSFPVPTSSVNESWTYNSTWLLLILRGRETSFTPQNTMGISRRFCVPRCFRPLAKHARFGWDLLQLCLCSARQQVGGEGSANSSSLKSQDRGSHFTLLLIINTGAWSGRDRVCVFDTHIPDAQ